MKLVILGDVHGEWTDLNITIAKALRKHPDTTALIQVGDLGYAWPGDRKGFKFSRVYFPSNEVFEYAKSLPFYWLDGNHENHDRLDIDQGASFPDMIYQPRGSVREFCNKRAMFFGGAASIDKIERIPFISWWPQENITQKQVLSALRVEGPIDIIFSHDHPLSFPYSDIRYGPENTFGYSDKKALDTILEAFRPRFWVFGHHHHFASSVHDSTIWACAPCIEERTYIVYDGEELIYENA